MAIINLPRIVRVGGGALAELPAAMAQLGLSRPFVVTDPFLAGSGMVDTLLGVLSAAGLEGRVFADTVSDPTAASVQAALALLATTTASSGSPANSPGVPEKHEIEALYRQIYP